MSSLPPAGSGRTPASYTPKYLADKILQSKPALEGERKQVTVLFADVQGSMELAERLDPEQWHQILDRFFQILTEGVHRFEGTVNQYTGDGIMALFGAPIAHEDHAQRACHAANGSAMKGATMLATLQALSVMPSLSRPAVSNDNPYSESLFKTLKYRPAYPLNPFADLVAARTGPRPWYSGTTTNTVTARSASLPPTNAMLVSIERS